MLHGSFLDPSLFFNFENKNKNKNEWKRNELQYAGNLTWAACFCVNVSYFTRVHFIETIRC